MNLMLESKNGVYKSWSSFYQQTKPDGLIRKGMNFPLLSYLPPPYPICWSPKLSLSSQVRLGSFGLIHHSQ